MFQDPIMLPAICATASCGLSSTSRWPIRRMRTLAAFLPMDRTPYWRQRFCHQLSCRCQWNLRCLSILRRFA
jgi:hypothetical protein